MPPTIPPTSIEFLLLVDGPVVAERVAPAVWTGFGNAFIDAEDSAVEEAVAGVPRIAEYSGLPVWFGVNIAALKSLGGQPPWQGLDKQQPKNGGVVLLQDHQSPLVHADLVV